MVAQVDSCLSHRAPRSKLAQYRFYGAHGISSRLRCCSDGGKNDVKWDDAWSKFKRFSRLPDMDSIVDKNPGESSGGIPRSSGTRPLGKSERQIRQQESALLNVWTQQWFFLLCGCGVFVLLAVFVAGVGPPPTDPRCTLPWC
jgi:hypothetical protein